MLNRVEPVALSSSLVVMQETHGVITTTKATGNAHEPGPPGPVRPRGVRARRPLLKEADAVLFPHGRSVNGGQGQQQLHVVEMPA